VSPPRKPSLCDCELQSVALSPLSSVCSVVTRRRSQIDAISLTSYYLYFVIFAFLARNGRGEARAADSASEVSHSAQVELRLYNKLEPIPRIRVHGRVLDASLLGL
jgi:hypothetical protein